MALAFRSQQKSRQRLNTFSFIHLVTRVSAISILVTGVNLIFSLLVARLLWGADYALFASFLGLVSMLATLLAGAQAQVINSRVLDEESSKPGAALVANQIPMLSRAFVVLVTLLVLSSISMATLVLPELWPVVVFTPLNTIAVALLSADLIRSQRPTRQALLGLSLVLANLLAQSFVFLLIGIEPSALNVATVYTISTSIVVCAWLLIERKPFGAYLPIGPGLWPRTIFFSLLWLSAQADILLLPIILDVREANNYALATLFPKYLVLISSMWGMLAGSRMQRKSTLSEDKISPEIVLSLLIGISAISGVIIFFFFGPALLGFIAGGEVNLSKESLALSFVVFAPYAYLVAKFWITGRKRFGQKSLTGFALLVMCQFALELAVRPSIEELLAITFLSGILVLLFVTLSSRWKRLTGSKA